MKIKLFTHTDLDGISAGIIGKLAFNDAIDITYADYHNIDRLVSRFIYSSHLDNYTHIFITDISVNKEVASSLNAVAESGRVKQVALIDHHDTAKWLADTYKWATVESAHSDGKKTAATGLFYDFLQKHFMPYMENVSAKRFVEMVRRYDTWDWKALGDYEPKQYNDLLSLMGSERFITKMLRELNAYGESFFLGEYDVEMLEMNQERIDRYVLAVERRLVRQKIGNHLVGVVFSERYPSELGNRLAVRNDDLDYILMINFHYGSYSFRTIKDDVHVGKIAEELFGGGGHQKAAGAQFHDGQKEYILYDILSSVKDHATVKQGA